MPWIIPNIQAAVDPRPLVRILEQALELLLSHLLQGQLLWTLSPQHACSRNRECSSHARFFSEGAKPVRFFHHSSSLQGSQKCCRGILSWNRAWKSPWKMPWNFWWKFAALKLLWNWWCAEQFKLTKAIKPRQRSLHFLGSEKKLGQRVPTLFVFIFLLVFFAYLRSEVLSCPVGGRAVLKKPPLKCKLAM